jgi:murein DD-endopeptidase MepM/ murein hydrolase activator NlpD
MRALLLISLIALCPGITVLAQTVPTPTDPLCPTPALDRLVEHTVSASDSLESLAKRYKLVPATIMGMNPSTRQGQLKPGETLFLPPFNGIRVEVPSGLLIKEIAAKYKVRADVLFELNGCQPAPRIVFIPGTNWSPAQGTRPTSITPKSVPVGDDAGAIAVTYPLPQQAKVLMAYGWKLNPTGTTGTALHSGVDLAADIGTKVLASADGTVAFAGNQDAYGQLVVINHINGFQTRYGQLGKIQVKVGQSVGKGQPIGTVGQSGKPSSADPHLHFEVRTNSKLGWVAGNPEIFLH